MKKVIMILMTAAAMTAMSCGDGRTARERENEDLNNTELAEPDITSMDNDTTSTNDMDRNDGVNDLDRDESGASEQDSIR